MLVMRPGVMSEGIVHLVSHAACAEAAMSHMWKIRDDSEGAVLLALLPQRDS